MRRRGCFKLKRRRGFYRKFFGFLRCRKPYKSYLAYLLLASVVVLSACTNGQSLQEKNAAALAKLQEMQDKISGAKTIDHVDAPDFSLTGIDGRNVSKESLLGSPYILQAFASWCATCIPEAARIKQVYDRFAGRGLKVVYVSVWDQENPADVADFRKRVGSPADWYWNVDRDRVSYKYGMLSTESTVLIDKDGKMVYRDDQDTDVDRLASEVSKVV
jgi:thiol-disulfide isomerase/thioredoxin